MNNITWDVKYFDNLTPFELYDIMKLRQDVFVIEQACFYHDLDNLDQKSFHVMGIRDGDVVACARILPPGMTHKECSIGRVITRATERGHGTGRTLMKKCLKFIDEEMLEEIVKISAQTYLLDFYGSLGFEKVSEEYIEDGIPHIDMIRRKPQ